MRVISEIIVHCSASDRLEDQSVRAITALHTTPRDQVYGDWGKYKEVQGHGCKEYCGYHIIINKTGFFFARPIEKPGAHCKGRNAHSIGVCVTGEVYFTPEQMDMLKGALNFLKTTFELTINDIKPHWHYNPHKTCPGFDLSKVLKELDD